MGLDIIRRNTNKILKILSDDYDAAIAKINAKGVANDLRCGPNEELDRLFRLCFTNVQTQIDTISASLP